MQISDDVFYRGQPCILRDFHNYSYTQQHLIITITQTNYINSDAEGVLQSVFYEENEVLVIKVVI